MTRAELNAAVRASLMLAPTRAERHGVYAVRPKPNQEK